MITMRATTTIRARPAAVIRFVADPVNAPLWMRALEVSEPLTPGPIRAGSRFREIQSAGGQRIETICEVVEYDGESRYAWKSVSDGPAKYGGGFSAASVGADCQLTYEGWATTTGPLARREEAWQRQAQREAEAELEAIRASVEADAQQSNTNQHRALRSR